MWYQGQLCMEQAGIPAGVTEDLQGKTITCDNFTSHGLQLLRGMLLMVEAVRGMSLSFPLLWCPRSQKQKNVLLMSILHQDAAVSTSDNKKSKS